jgi:hypothetical protein
VRGASQHTTLTMTSVVSSSSPSAPLSPVRPGAAKLSSPPSLPLHGSVSPLSSSSSISPINDDHDDDWDNSYTSTSTSTTATPSITTPTPSSSSSHQRNVSSSVGTIGGSVTAKATVLPAALPSRVLMPNALTPPPSTTAIGNGSHQHGSNGSNGNHIRSSSEASLSLPKVEKKSLFRNLLGGITSGLGGSKKTTKELPTTPVCICVYVPLLPNCLAHVFGCF